MKSAGVIYKKLKEVKFKHLIVLYKKHLNKIPENCKYNYLYSIKGSDNNCYPIRLCMLHQELPDSNEELKSVYPHLIDICQCSEDIKNCNGFTLKYSREDIKNLFDKELTTKNIREKKYPDICALEWVLEKTFLENKPRNWIENIYIKIKNILRGKHDQKGSLSTGSEKIEQTE